MRSLEITDDQHDRLTVLREELADTHADSYSSVTLPDTMAYLLDLADIIDDPDRRADIQTIDAPANHSDPFPRAELEAKLSERNRRQATTDSESPMDLYSIAAEYEISGRSNMTKQELITAILDTVERRYTDPLAGVDIDFPDAATNELNIDGATADDSTPEVTTDTQTDNGPTEAVADEATGNQADDDDQLNAMLKLLDTHSDKWWSADGEARYEVELPDGSVESARTKDDVRATLFKHY